MAVATELSAAIKTLVEAARAGTDERVFERRASEKNPIYAADMTLPCWSVALNDDRPTRTAWAKKKFVTYTATLTYLTKELPGDRAASARIETALDVASKLFCRPGLPGVSAVSDADVKPGKPYALPGPAQTVNCSPLVLTFECIEDSQ